MELLYHTERAGSPAQTQTSRDPGTQSPRPRDPEDQIPRDPDPETQTQRTRPPETQTQRPRPRDPETQRPRPRDPDPDPETQTSRPRGCSVMYLPVPAVAPPGSAGRGPVPPGPQTHCPPGTEPVRVELVLPYECYLSVTLV